VLLPPPLLLVVTGWWVYQGARYVNIKHGDHRDNTSLQMAVCFRQAQLVTPQPQACAAAAAAAAGCCLL
jgi:hypothetical protein